MPVALIHKYMTHLVSIHTSYNNLTYRIPGNLQRVYFQKYSSIFENIFSSYIANYSLITSSFMVMVLLKYFKRIEPSKEKIESVLPSKQKIEGVLQNWMVLWHIQCRAQRQKPQIRSAVREVKSLPRALSMNFPYSHPCICVHE